MAHLVETMFFVGELPWHGLGVDATAVKIESSLAALTLAGLNWTVSKNELFHKVGDSVLPIVGNYVNVRSSDSMPLGIVGENYTILQNSDAYAVLDSLLAQGLKFETGGSLKNGREVFALMRLPQIVVGQDDVTDNFLLISNSHDGSKAISFGLTQVRVVCNNTLTMALNSHASKLLKIRHTKKRSTGP
jgi:phage/plasmid-like protein (TIGR03299 family)